MSEKRQRNQQRRQRRKAKRTSGSSRRTASPEEMLAEVAVLAATSIRDAEDALEAEEWASNFIGGLRRELAPDEPIDPDFFAALLVAVEALATKDALAVLRALSAIEAEGAAAGAARLAATGVPEPAWGDALGRARPTAAVLLHEPAFDDGVSVIVEFADPTGDAYALSVIIDHNLGGIVKDVFLADPIAALAVPEDDRVAVRDLDLGEARARIQDAFDVLDTTPELPVDEDIRSLRALLETRLRLLPDGVELPDPYVPILPEERDALLADFVTSPEGNRWRDDQDAEYVVQLAIEFGADYNYGGPLRWSPAVVDTFMLDWLAQKAPEAPEFFTRVPEVLADWVAYAGRRRGLPDDALREAVAAVGESREAMLEMAADPDSWDLAKTFFNAAREAGIDATDRDALERFAQSYDDAGG